LPLAPRRLLDTRAIAQRVGVNSVREVSVAGANGVPGDAIAAMLNVTVTGSKDAGFVTVFPCGTAPPDVSNVNFVTGQTVANASLATIGAGGNVCFYTSADIDLIVDLNGAYTPSATASLVPMAPQRLIDTRVAGGPIPPGSPQEVTISDAPGVPAGTVAVALNVTATGTQAAGYVTVYPCGTSVPDVSNLNFTAGDTVPNSVTVPVGSNGKICFYTSATTHGIVDINGAYTIPS
jgi:hypothetical protein